MAREPQQASPMSKMNETKLPSTPWPFWTCIHIYYLLQGSKNDDEEHCF